MKTDGKYIKRKMGGDLTYNVGGIEFATQEQAEQAKRELEIIKGLRIKLDLNNPTIAKRTFENCQAKGIFQTQLGLNFLSSLQKIAEGGASRSSAFIECEDCGNKILRKAKACPNCGCPVDIQELHPVVMCVITGAMLTVIILTLILR
ncbi:MAG: hypothetical protein FWH04_08700 [Oscillospiraceae bacterium]|nr:hypothetical protein [Oscillospiraceae bacterium]